MTAKPTHACSSRGSHILSAHLFCPEPYNLKHDAPMLAAVDVQPNLTRYIRTFQTGYITAPDPANTASPDSPKTHDSRADHSSGTHEIALPAQIPNPTATLSLTASGIASTCAFAPMIAARASLTILCMFALEQGLVCHWFIPHLLVSVLARPNSRSLVTLTRRGRDACPPRLREQSPR